MKFIILFISSLTLYTSLTFGQSLNDTIIVDKTYGTSFIYQDKYLNNKQLYNITRSNFEANYEMRKARSALNTSYFLAFTGSYLVGWQLGKAAFGNSPKWSIAGIGAGLIIVSIPFKRSYVIYAVNSVQIYNKGIKDQAGQHVIKMNLSLSGDGIGIKLIL